MQGKKIKNGALESALDTFLAEKEYLVMGFEKDRSNVYHRVFKDRLDNYALMSPVFAMNGALYLRRLFAKGAQIILMLRPCEIRSYVELVKLTQIEPENIIAVSVDCFGTVSSKTEGDIPPERSLKGSRRMPKRRAGPARTAASGAVSSVTRGYASTRTGTTGPFPTRTRDRRSSPFSKARPPKRPRRWQ